MDFQRKTELDVSSFDQGVLSEQFWSYAYSLPDKYTGHEEPGTVYLSEEYAEMLPIGTELCIKVSQDMVYMVHIAGYIDVEDSLPAGGGWHQSFILQTRQRIALVERVVFSKLVLCA